LFYRKGSHILKARPCIIWGIWICNTSSIGTSPLWWDILARTCFECVCLCMCSDVTLFGTGLSNLGLV
jgi:hypothetical protein